eukprot:TRINITY_DN90_c3_g1_i1.p1 TRINITY_DN90_c3_g1~~TRINITY_DN90_c3_g1_i1.p1  ORF type:complete len:81 (+),score=16.67 TRINITY_DN90_c3_g1_i1:458-700(+)
MSKTYTWNEINKHNSQEDLWIVIKGKVYDVTTFYNDHPGGGDLLLDAVGEDAEELFFEDIEHSEEAVEMLKDFYIGDLKE